MADMKISELSSVASLNNGDLIEVSQVDSSSPTGYTSMKASMKDVGDKVVNEIQYTQELDTSAKKITGAINENNSNIGSLSQLTTTDKSSLVGAVNEVNKVTTGTLTVDSAITLTRHTLVKANNVKVLSVVFQTGATVPAILGTITSGFEPAYNVDFTGVSDNGTPCRFRIQAGSNTVTFTQTIPPSQTIRVSVAYI